MFGQLCAELQRLMDAEHRMYQDLEDFHAPGECAVIVCKSLERQRDEVLTKYGFTRESFSKELRARTSDRFAYIVGDFGV